jgi:hypothetical protein
MENGFGLLFSLFLLLSVFFVCFFVFSLCGEENVR